MNNSYKNTYIDLYDIVSKELTDNNISIDFSYNDICWHYNIFKCPLNIIDLIDYDIESFIKNVYSSLLVRECSNEEIQAYLNKYRDETTLKTIVLKTIVNSAEYNTNPVDYYNNVLY